MSKKQVEPVFTGKRSPDVSRFLKEHWKNGVHCPECHNMVRLNEYQFHQGMARVLVELYKATMMGRTDEYGYLHVEDYLVKIGSTIKGVVGKMKYWGLVEEAINEDTKKKRSGYWKITQLGTDFVTSKVKVKKSVFVYLDQVKGWGEETVSIGQAFGKEFDYAEAMESYYNRTDAKEPDAQQTLL